MGVIDNGGCVPGGAIMRDMITKPNFRLLLLLGGLLLLVACEPLVPSPTPQTIIVTATASPAPTLTPSFTPSATPAVTDTLTPTMSPTAPACAETTGQIIEFDEFDSVIAGQNMPYRVYVPPCYFTFQRRYPVVYLIHGAANDDTHWQDLGIVDTLDRGLSLGLYPPMIIVMPYGGGLLPSTDYDADETMESFMMDELIPRIEQDFCTWEDRDYRAIGGISRGGFWALSMALRNPDFFGVVAGHSAELDSAAPPAVNPLDLALSAPFVDTLRIYLDNGANDLVRPDLEELSNNFVQRRVPHEYVINPLGDHTDGYWTAHLADYLAFYGGTAENGWPRDEGELPSCLEPSP